MSCCGDKKGDKQERRSFAPEERERFRAICKACPYRVTWFGGSWWCGASWIVSPEKVVAAGANIVQRIADGIGLKIEVPAKRPGETCGCAITWMLRWGKPCPKGRWP